MLASGHELELKKITEHSEQLETKYKLQLEEAQGNLNNLILQYKQKIESKDDLIKDMQESLQIVKDSSKGMKEELE